MSASTALPPEIKALMNLSVNVMQQNVISKFGEKTYGLRGVYKCYPVEDVTLVVSTEGREERTAITLYLDSDGSIEPTDHITYKSISRPIVALQTWYDSTPTVWGQVAYLR